MTQQQQTRQILLSPIGRVSFHSIHEKTSYLGSKPKYEITLIFDREDADLQSLVQQITACSRAAREAGRVAGAETRIANPLRSGEVKAHLDGYGEGKVFCVFRSERKPVLVDAQLREHDNADANFFYNGCTARVKYSVFFTDKGGPKVCLGLEGVQKVSDGEPFGVGQSTAEGFTAIEGQNADDEAMEAEAASLFDGGSL